MKPHRSLPHEGPRGQKWPKMLFRERSGSASLSPLGLKGAPCAPVLAVRALQAVLDRVADVVLYPDPRSACVAGRAHAFNQPTHLGPAAHLLDLVRRELVPVLVPAARDVAEALEVMRVARWDGLLAHGQVGVDERTRTGEGRADACGGREQARHGGRGGLCVGKSQRGQTVRSTGKQEGRRTWTFSSTMPLSRHPAHSALASSRSFSILSSATPSLATSSSSVWHLTCHAASATSACWRCLSKPSTNAFVWFSSEAHSSLRAQCVKSTDEGAVEPLLVHEESDDSRLKTLGPEGGLPRRDVNGDARPNEAVLCESWM